MSPVEQPSSGDEVLPRVASRSSNRGVWLFGVGLAAAGLLLFQTLEARRALQDEPNAMRPADAPSSMIVSPPDLVLPSSYAPADDQTPVASSSARDLPSASERPVTAFRVVRTATPSEREVPSQNLAPGRETAPDLQLQNGYRTAAPTAADPQGFAGPKPDSEGSADRQDGKDRVQSTRFKNPSTTVPKGVVIQAVLETALESTRSGFARAIVSRDVYAFDGGKILIPRGSRLIGDYKADVTPSQKRVLVQWSRLMLPDGVLINLDSPAADPLGRAGVGGKVNSHFFERFAGSILQSTLEIGEQLASQRISRNTYVLALPGTTQGLVAPQGDKIAPTIKVRQGSSVSVFVARDLDFTSTEQ